MSTARGGGGRSQRWSVQPLTPLMEGPDLEEILQEEGIGRKEISNWDAIREWFRLQTTNSNSNSNSKGTFSIMSNILYGDNHANVNPAKMQDLRLLLGVLGCPLAPIPLSTDQLHTPLIITKNSIPFETSTANYIIQQYLAASGCFKQKDGKETVKNMYATGVLNMICCETEVSTGGGGGVEGGVRSFGTKSGESGCFVVWQMSPGMWSLELSVGSAYKVVAGSDGKIVWRHTPWLGTHAAKGPHRPLRRLIQGLDPKSTARLFEEALLMGERRIGEEDCFVLKVSADRAAVTERNDGPAEVLRHVLYGYFSQKSGLLIYLEDSHLTRVMHTINDNKTDGDDSAVYWETTIGSSIGDYRDVDGLMIAHRGRTVATVFRFGDDLTMQYSRTRMEELWRIHDVVFNVPGLSADSFIPPADIFHSLG
ncbi:uncharacterized protein LOC124922044 [Impatiens glandulifera]|uniref:uncharacterized protein LOC124922044 n=1 Tax=Impatiens glandulifera TaxID=253017 RepID=UPI001FB152CC|nr:uncharacterized protein LOC124922044 [Impatiens glandulifera]